MLQLRTGILSIEVVRGKDSRSFCQKQLSLGLGIALVRIDGLHREQLGSFIATYFRPSLPAIDRQMSNTGEQSTANTDE